MSLSAGTIQTNVKDRHGKFNVAKMAWTFGHIFTTGGAHERTINRTELGIIQPLFPRPLSLLILLAYQYHVTAK